MNWEKTAFLIHKKGRNRDSGHGRRHIANKKKRTITPVKLGTGGGEVPNEFRTDPFHSPRPVFSPRT